MRAIRVLLQRVLLSVLASLVLATSLVATAASARAETPEGGGDKSGTADIPRPTSLKVDRLSESKAPSLVIDVTTDPPTVQVGQTTKLTVTVTNQASAAARDLKVDLPLPDGTVPASGEARAKGGWQWTRGTLGGGETASFDASVKVELVPHGRALVARPRATARDLTVPVQNVGGALVTEPGKGKGKAEFRPGETTVVRAEDNRVTVELASGAADKGLTVRASTVEDRRAEGKPVPPPMVGSKRGLDPIFLDAVDTAGVAVHQFSEPVTISARYTQEQLAVLGIAEDDLTLFWYDEEHRNWVPLPTDVDTENGVAATKVDHFSAFALSDGSSPSAAFLPSLQGWQVNHQTGSASFSYPIELPAGPAGLRPKLELGYNSGATDGDAGKRPKHQAGWVGKGWSLETGSVSRNKITIDPATDRWVDHFALTVNGQSFDLVQAEPLPGNTGANDRDPTHWAWRPTHESFIRARIVVTGTSTDGSPGRGGMVNGTWQPRHTWKIWSKDGTIHEFSEDLWWGWNRCAIANGVDFEAYKWLLSKTTDTRGNTISYHYGRNSMAGSQTSCDWWNYARGTVDRDAWPTAITWGANPGTGVIDRYKVDFLSSPRENDTAYEGADNQYLGGHGQPRETRRLNAVAVASNSTGSWQLVRQYNFGYDYSLLSDQTISSGGSFGANPAFPKLTLKSIQRIANDGVTALPAQTFAYNTVRGTTLYPNGGWNRLMGADNGQGGVTSFTYQNVGAALGRGLFSNNHRVVGRTQDDGRGNRPTWQIAYGTANYNSLGTTLMGSAAYGTQANPNSATLYFNKYWEPIHPYDNWLAHRQLKEFRGHDYVRETAPDSTQTEHWFYLGDHPCGYPRDAAGNPVKGATAILNHPCFQQLRDREFLKGKEQRTRVLSGAGAVLRDTEHSFRVDFASYSDNILTGLWRAFVYEDQRIDRTHNGAPEPVTKTTKYVYDPARQVGGKQYGNLTDTEEYGDNGALERVTRHFFTTRDDASSYLVDRRWMEVVLDGQRRLLAVTQHFFDGANQAPQAIGPRGDITRTSKYYNVPLQADALGVTLQGNDTTFGYDPYGNRTTVTTYAGPGTRLWSGGGNWTVSVPGGGSAARTTRTDYDPTFHALAVKVTGPTGLTEQAAYNLRMGLMNSVTDANSNVTVVRYDVFGRTVKMVKPGDSESAPTVQAYYFDTERPFRYVVCLRELAGQAACRPVQRFYDGLGREIQTKSETGEATQNVVIDKVYDGLDRVVRQSQPRYRGETPSTTFWKYVPPATDAEMRWTTTSYDGLGRPLVVTQPDSRRTEHRYTVAHEDGTTVLIDDVTDPNRHRTQQRHDAFGRLVKVWEISGECDNTPAHPCGAGDTMWAPYAATTYIYNALDLLTRVADHAGNVTTMTYDSLGRKLAMADPDMGSWSYVYDANGNLVRQTDAKARTITFRYDSLDRQTSKVFPDGTQTTYRYDEAVSNGKGQRTSMVTPVETTRWQFDSRGRATRTTHVIDGLTREFQRTYDSADRVQSVRYPNGEVLQYRYDAGWRPVSACGSTCYIQSATWTALDQPDVWRFGTSSGTLAQDWNYDNPTQRLAGLTVGGLFNRSYKYDKAGNVKEITDNLPGGSAQSFAYDHRDRLVTWTPAVGAAASTYTYDVIGNLTTKDSQTYNYAAQSPANGGPHAVKAKGSQTFRYDANGNLVSGGGREITWNAQNLPSTIKGPDGVTESYGYDGDDERVRVVRGTTKTIYLEGLWEEVVGGAVKSYYAFNGQVVAFRQGSTVRYIHGDHLGSAALVTNQTGGLVGRQEFDPWGKVRSGGVHQTSLNYTGQRLDGTGLLYYHARMYDPALARFISADSIVPAIPQGGGRAVGQDQEASVRPLAVDFHEGKLAFDLARENSFTMENGFHFQLDSEGRKKEKSPWGPSAPQTLNRYSYVANNPLSYTDPTGHTMYLDPVAANELAGALYDLAKEVGDAVSVSSLLLTLGGLVTAIIAKFSLTSLAAAIFTAVAGSIAAIVAAAGTAVGLYVLGEAAGSIRELADYIVRYTDPTLGIAIGTDGDTMYFLNRGNGAMKKWDSPWWMDMSLPGSLYLGVVRGKINNGGWYFCSDSPAC